jgi:hypothetical protein
MMRQRVLAFIVATLTAGLALVACGSPRPAPVPTASPSASATASPAASPVATPSASPAARLTMKQGRAPYIRIVDPLNRVAATANTDVQDGAPFSQVRADELAYAVAVRTAARQLRAIRWPAHVQPFITAMLLTYVPANIRCAREEAAAGSMAAANNVAATSQDCITEQDTSIPDEIRARFGLPPLSG